MARAHRQIWICEYTPQRVLSLLVMVDRKRRARDLPRTGAEYAERINRSKVRDGFCRLDIGFAGGPTYYVRVETNRGGADGRVAADGAATFAALERHRSIS